MTADEIKQCREDRKNRDICDSLWLARWAEKLLAHVERDVLIHCPECGDAGKPCPKCQEIIDRISLDGTKGSR
jgi:hypothetical protein